MISRDHFLFWHKKTTGNNYVFDKVSEPIFKQLTDFFAAPVRRQGLLLCGPVGVGKTTLMRYFGRFAQFRVVSCSAICRAYQQYGNEIFTDYAYPSMPMGASVEQAKGVCFDDLGAESAYKAVHYGTSLAVIAEMIMEVYNHRTNW